MTANNSDVIRDLPIEYRSVVDLIPYDNNAKRHPAEQVQRIAASMKKFGWASSKPIEVTVDDVIINGHGRRLAAIQLLMKVVPVVVRSDIKTDEEIREYRLADNKAAESEFDTTLLNEELSFLVNEKSLDLSWMFSDKELQFVTDDLGMLDINALTDDLASQVDKHNNRTQDLIRDEGKREVTLSKAFGFGKVTANQQRKIALLMGHAEQQTGLTGADALADWITDYVGLGVLTNE